MHRAFLKLMLPFLLLAQVGVGMSPGHAVCIALDACCGAHDHAAPAGLEHHAHTHDADGGHPGPCAHQCSEGSCHIHIALPDDGGSMRDRSHEHFCDIRLLAPALAVLAADLGCARVSPQAALPPPWAWPACDRTCARETDCLVI